MGSCRKLHEKDKTNDGCTYKAPEQYSGNGYDKTIDWWALGVIAHLLTFVKTPYPRGDPHTYRPYHIKRALLKDFKLRR